MVSPMAQKRALDGDGSEDDGTPPPNSATLASMSPTTVTGQPTSTNGDSPTATHTTERPSDRVAAHSDTANSEADYHHFSSLNNSTSRNEHELVNPGNLKHPYLINLDNDIARHALPDAPYAKSKARYTSILAAATAHERTINDMLRGARKKAGVDGVDDIVADLEFKLVDASEMRARAETVLEDLEDCRVEMEGVAATIVELDDRIEATESKLAGLCDGLV